MSRGEYETDVAEAQILRSSWLRMLEQVSASLWRLWPRLSNHVRATSAGATPPTGPLESPVILLDELYGSMQSLDLEVALLAGRRPPRAKGPTGLWLDRLALREVARDRILNLTWETAMQLVDEAFDRTRDMAVPDVAVPEGLTQERVALRVLLAAVRQNLQELKRSWEVAVIGGLVAGGENAPTV